MVYKNRRFVRKSFGKKKRWYFNAQADIPLWGKGKIGFGSGKAKRGLDKHIRSVVRRNEEAKYKVFNTTVATAKHDTLYTLNVCGNIARGTTMFNRIGDEIFLNALHLKIGAFNAIDDTCMVRVMVVKSDKDHLAADDTLNTGLGSSEMFLVDSAGTSTFSAGMYQGILDPKLVTCVYDKLITINTPLSGKKLQKSTNIFIPIHQKFQYETASNYGKKENWYVVCSAWSYGGTVGTTTSAGINLTGKLIFKDD